MGKLTLTLALCLVATSWSLSASAGGPGTLPQYQMGNAGSDGKWQADGQGDDDRILDFRLLTNNRLPGSGGKPTPLSIISVCVDFEGNRGGATVMSDGQTAKLGRGECAFMGLRPGGIMTAKADGVQTVNGTFAIVK